MADFVRLFSLLSTEGDVVDVNWLAGSIGTESDVIGVDKLGSLVGTKDDDAKFSVLFVLSSCLTDL